MKKLYIITLLAINSAFCISAMNYITAHLSKEQMSEKELAFQSQQLLNAVGKKKVDSALITFHLMSHADVNAKNNFCNTALHLAAYNGNTNAIKILLENGANVHAVNNNGATPLHMTAKKGHIKAMKQLLTEGAMPQKRITSTFSNIQISNSKNVALVNLVNNLQFYTLKDVCFEQIINNIKELRKEIASIIPLNDKNFKQSLCSIIPEINDLKQKRLQSMKSLIETPNNENKTALDIAIDKNHENLLQTMQSIINAQSLQELPEEIEQKTEDSIIREFLASDENFTLA